MSSKYKIRDQAALHFVTYTSIGWIDVFTRTVYKDIVVDSLNHCILHKGLQVYAWCLMTNHIHLIIGTHDKPIESILRDHKRHTSEMIHAAIKNEGESRKEWMLPIFRQAGIENSHNRGFQFWQQDNHPIELQTREMLLQR